MTISKPNYLIIIADDLVSRGELAIIIIRH